MNFQSDREYENYRSDESDSKYLSDKKLLSSSKNNNTFRKEPQSLSRHSAHDYERKIQELCERIEILEANCSKITQQKNKLVQKLKDVSDENDKFQEQIARLASNNQKQNEEIYQLNNRLTDLNNKEKSINERCKSKFEILHKEIEAKDEQLEKLYSQLRAKEETVKFFSTNQDQNIKNQGALHDEIDKLKKDKYDFQNKLAVLQKQLEEFYINRKSEAGLLLEIEHLKDDNKRLLNLLKNTEEYKDFAYLAEDCSGGIKYVGNDTKARGFSARNKKTDKKFTKTNDPNNEENWVPNEVFIIYKKAYSFTHDFKNKYKIEMNEELISDLLTSLNKIWRQREKKVIERAILKSKNEVMNLRRQVTMKTGYDEFTAQKTISKLKKDLKNAREECRKFIIERNKLADTPAGLSLVDNALKIASNYQRSKKNMEIEVKNLHKQLGEKESKEYKDNYDRLKFNEGSLWMISRCLNELQNLYLKIQEIITDFQNRMKPTFIDIEVNSKTLQLSCSWFTQTLDKIAMDYIEKFKDWHYTTNKNVDNLNGTLMSI